MPRESGDMAQRHLKKVRQLSEEAERAARAFHEAMLEARLSGEVYRDIAEWARMPHQRVHDIVQRLKRERGLE